MARWDFWNGIASICGAAIVFVVLLWRRKASLSSKSVRFAVFAALLSLLVFLIPIGMQIQRQLQRDGPLYAILSSCDVLCVLVAWWLPLIGFLLSYRFVNNSARHPGFLRSPIRIALALAFCTAFALALRRITQLSYLSMNGAEPLWSAMHRLSWLLIVLQAILLSYSAATLGWYLWKERILVVENMWFIRAAICVAILAEIGGTAARSIANDVYRYAPMGRPIVAMVRDHISYLFSLAAFLPALTWPRGALRAEGFLR